MKQLNSTLFTICGNLLVFAVVFTVSTPIIRPESSHKSEKYIEYEKVTKSPPPATEVKFVYVGEACECTKNNIPFQVQVPIANKPDTANRKTYQFQIIHPTYEQQHPEYMKSYDFDVLKPVQYHKTEPQPREELLAHIIEPNVQTEYPSQNLQTNIIFNVEKPRAVMTPPKPCECLKAVVDVVALTKPDC